jgi:hypothetical protein
MRRLNPGDFTPDAGVLSLGLSTVILDVFQLASPADSIASPASPIEKPLGQQPLRTSVLFLLKDPEKGTESR